MNRCLMWRLHAQPARPVEMQIPMRDGKSLAALEMLRLCPEGKGGRL